MPSMCNRGHQILHLLHKTCPILHTVSQLATLCNLSSASLSALHTPPAGSPTPSVTSGTSSVVPQGSAASSQGGASSRGAGSGGGGAGSRPSLLQFVLQSLMKHSPGVSELPRQLEGLKAAANVQVCGGRRGRSVAVEKGNGHQCQS